MSILFQCFIKLIAPKRNQRKSEDVIQLKFANRGNQLASGSEDGTVRLWDIRQNEVTSIIQPHTNGKVARPNLGKWIGAVDLTEDWLVSEAAERVT